MMNVVMIRNRILKYPFKNSQAILKNLIHIVDFLKQ